MRKNKQINMLDELGIKSINDLYYTPFQIVMLECGT